MGGKDLVREFFYDRSEGKIVEEMNFLPSGLCTGMADGPRYLEFHPKYNTMYVVNELSSTIAVFAVNKKLIKEINEAAKNGESLKRFKGKSTLTLIQSINTIPTAFPKKMNTCGRLCLHRSGRFILVSNRGHQSLAIFKVREQGSNKGQLSSVGYFHTRGATPRHFKFDHSGQYLLVANQDSDNVSIFNFNQCTGELKFTGNDYHVPSPNFICCCKIHDVDEPNRKSSFSSLDSSISEEVSESGSTVTVHSRKQLEDELAKALLEIERLKKSLDLVAT